MLRYLGIVDVCIAVDPWAFESGRLSVCPITTRTSATGRPAYNQENLGYPENRVTLNRGAAQHHRGLRRSSMYLAASLILVE